MAIPLWCSHTVEQDGVSHDKDELMNSKMDPIGRAIADVTSKTPCRQ